MSAKKFDRLKPRLDLIPPEVIYALSIILTIGAEKYGARNWEEGMDKSRVFAAAQRHLWHYWSGKKIDEETNTPTLWGALASVAFLVTYEFRDMGGEVPNDSLTDFSKLPDEVVETLEKFLKKQPDQNERA